MHAVMDPRQERAPGFCRPVSAGVPPFVEKATQESRQVGSDMDHLVLPEAINATRAMLRTEPDRHGRDRAKRGVAEAPHEMIGSRIGAIPPLSINYPGIKLPQHSARMTGLAFERDQVFGRGGDAWGRET